MNATEETDIADRAVAFLNDSFATIPDVRLEFQKIGERSVDGLLCWGGSSVPFVSKGHVTGIGQLRILYTDLLRQQGKGILLLPPLSKKVRDELNEARINYIDSEGNAFVDLPGLQILVNSASKDSALNVPTGKGFQANGLKLIHAVFLQPDLLQQRYRVINEQTGISTGGLSSIFEDLRLQGFIIDNAGKPTFTNGRELTRRWAYSYIDGLRNKIHRGYLRSLDNRFIEYAQRQGSGELLLGGEYGAMMRGDHLSSQQVSIYTDLPISELIQRYRLRPIKSPKDEPVTEVLRPFWSKNIRTKTYLAQNVINYLVADGLVLYGDLLSSTNPRVLDAAEHLLDHELRDRFAQFGLRW